MPSRDEQRVDIGGQRHFAHDGYGAGLNTACLGQELLADAGIASISCHQQIAGRACAILKEGSYGPIRVFLIVRVAFVELDDLIQFRQQHLAQCNAADRAR